MPNYQTPEQQLETLKRKLKKVQDHLIIWTAEGLTDVADMICEVARILVPVDTGELRDSIKVIELIRNEIEMMTSVQATAHHATEIEYGGPFKQAQPYMRPAVEIVKQAATNVLLNRVRKGVGTLGDVK